MNLTKVVYENYLSKTISGVRKIAVVAHNIPPGLPTSVLTEAGSMIVAIGAETPDETGAPTADNLVWVSNLSLAKKGEWKALVTGSGTVELTNKSGSDLTAGTVVIFDVTNDEAFTTTSIANDRRVCGLLAEDIDNNAAGQVAVRGKIATVKVQGNVTIGNWLTTSTTAGRAAQYGSSKPRRGGIGIALTSYSGGGAGTVEALVDIDLQSGYKPIAVLGTPATQNNTGTTTTATFTQSAGSNRIGFAIVDCQNSATVSGVTWGGVAMTRLGTGVNGSSERMEIYYILEASLPADGSKSVTATTSGSVYCSVHAYMLENAKQSSPSSPVTGTSASATTMSGNVTVSVAGSFVLTAAFVSTTASFMHGEGQEEMTDSSYASHGTTSCSYEEYEATGTKNQSDTASAGARMLWMATVVEPA